jgi:hypothetical protein
VKSARYEAHYALFFNLLSLHPSSVQIISLASCSQTPSVHVPPLMPEAKDKITLPSKIDYKQILGILSTAVNLDGNKARTRFSS